jgi:acyl-[acyl-carrier-protein]-phospholipid O-acyltransferase/long-chain-fatty-acid--[acyl-carrier-protein] ligase
VSWFWLVGAVTLSLVPVVIKSRIGAGIEVETAINLFFAIGIAGGSLLAAVIAHGRINLAPAPYLLLAMAATLIDLGWTTGALPQTTAELGLVDFFASAVGLHIAADILALSAVSGLFVVPIFAAVQAWAGVDRRARVIGAVNTLNAIYMVSGSLATTLLLKLAGLTEPAALAMLGLLNILAALYFFWRLPKRAD